MAIFTPPAGWDAGKFAQRYNLNFLTDFYVNAEGQLVVVPDLPDNPPIWDLSESVVPTPPGIWIHGMTSLVARVGNKLVASGISNCYHIIVDHEIKLSDPWFTGLSLEIGTTAYLVDKEKTVLWDGVKWK